ncbi:DUF2510 domain-containing protein [Microbacterium sp. Leaf320]|uniref:DUF2510 domain-containing protein n=1 Tax=Microbacterium sp. Leaf320 TaxID=1736334 RepID=UPI0006FB3707|nr:DUF2510 domain-containing protein [Microbacterium sp. Leaf320]KQQ65681.1 hypothetical protein ASF63_09975 [Microbacterium sp. Leaf320]
MTTPAGWYDDGSGRQRWWDGTQWTEHFAPIAEPSTTEAEPSATEAEPSAIEAEPSLSESSSAGHDTAATDDGAAAADESPAVDTTPESAAAAETAASLDSVAAVESPSWNAPAGESVAADSGSDSSSPVDEVAAPDSAASWSAPEAPSDASSTEYTAPGATTPLDGNVPPYANAAPAYPGNAPAYPGADAGQTQAYPAPGYPGAAPGHPGASPYAPAGQAYGVAGGYPPAYGGTAPAAPTKPSILGIVGLGLAALGTILSCIPVIFGFGWLLLAAGFIVSLISLFLKGKKWPGISGLILSVVGAIIAIVMFFVIVFATVSEVVRDLPTAPPSSDSDTDNGTDPGTDDGTDDGDTGPTDVVEGELGSPVTIQQMSGTSEVTINSATWATSDGSSIPSTNGGYVILDVTFTGISGTSYINPFYFALETAEGAEGTYDYYVDGIVAEELAAGDTVNGKITFDVAQSSSYEIIFTDELLQEVARVSFTPSAG